MSPPDRASVCQLPQQSQGPSGNQPQDLHATSLALTTALHPGQAQDLLQAWLVEGQGVLQRVAVGHCVPGMMPNSGATVHAHVRSPMATQVKDQVEFLTEVL